MNDLQTTDTLDLDIALALDRAKALKVTDNETRLKASESRKQIKQWEKEVSAKYDGVIAELRKPYQEMLDERKELTDTLKTLDTIFKTAIASFDQAQERLAREKALEEERRRLEALKQQEETGIPAVVPEPEPAPVYVAPVKSAGEYTVDVWEYEVVDFSLVPDAFKVIDASKLSAHVKTMKDLANVAGVKVTCRKDIRQRA